MDLVTLVAKEREEISVQMWTGETVPLDMEPQNTIVDVKRKVSEKKGVDAQLLRIIYKDEELADEQSLESIQTKAGSNYFILAAKQKMQVNLVFISGTNMTQDMNTTDGILDVKQRVETKDGVPKDHVKLTFKDEELTDDLTLDAVRVKANANVVDIIAKERVTLDVKTPKGEIIQHDMVADNTFGECKDRHTAKVGVEKRNIKLYYGGKEITDDQALQVVKLQEHANDIPIDARERITVNTWMLDGTQIPQDMETTDCILDLKRRVGDKEGIDAALIKISYKDKECPDDQKLEVLKIQEHSNTVRVKAQEKMALSVKMISGSIMAMDMVTTDTVLDVKKRVGDKEKVEPHLVILKFKEEELHDEATLGDVKNKANSNSIALLANERDEISVQMPNGDIVQLDMEPTDTVLNVKEHLQEKEGIEARLLRVFFKDQELFDDSNLASVVDLAGSNFFTLNAKEKMQMQVTMPNGEMTPYDMITSDNIGNLKDRIQAKEHLDRQLIKINYNGEEQTDDVTLDKLKMQAHSHEIPVEAKEKMQINVTTLKGETVSHEMVTTDSIVDIKQRHQDRDGIDKAVIKLNYAGKEITDEKTLDLVRDQVGSHAVPLTQKERMNINCTMISGDVMPMDMETTDTVKDIKFKV